jgi:hypothetical protein
MDQPSMRSREQARHGFMVGGGAQLFFLATRVCYNGVRSDNQM